MSYSHLSAEERLKFYKLRVKSELSLRQIAKQMKRSQSPLSRELQRNSGDTSLYLPDLAQQQQQRRRAGSKKAFESVRIESIAAVKRRLKKYHSPEQIAEKQKREGQV
jgi:IS30 family transposase